MTNIIFDGTDLSSLGFSLQTLAGRGMAPWKIDTIEIPGRASVADVSRSFVVTESQTVLNGFLSADTDNYSLYTHAQWLARFDALKALINPERGFRKLSIADQPNRFRWCRYLSMSDFTEQRPVLKLPFQPCNIVFQNLEPHWRESNPPITVTASGTQLPNSGPKDTLPIVQLNISQTVAALSGPRIQPVTLLTIDDIDMNWKGTTTDGTLDPGDVVLIDAENNTVTKVPGGTGQPTDVIRYYDYGGAGAYISNGFPKIDADGSTVNYLHPAVGSAVVTYDIIYP